MEKNTHYSRQARIMIMMTDVYNNIASVQNESREAGIMIMIPEKANVLMEEAVTWGEITEFVMPESTKHVRNNCAQETKLRSVVEVSTNVSMSPRKEYGR